MTYIGRHTRCHKCLEPYYWTIRPWKHTVRGWLCPRCQGPRQARVEEAASDALHRT